MPGEKLRAEREARGVGQEAAAAEIGVSRYSMIAWEGGASRPAPSSVVKISAWCGKTLEEVASWFDGETRRFRQNDRSKARRFRIRELAAEGLSHNVIARIVACPLDVVKKTIAYPEG